ncbi:MAG: hypothetical protein ACOX5R_03100 [bacterium]|jgi:hypothetical protein
MKVSILTHYDLIPEIDVLSRKLARKSNITARIGYLTPELNQLLQDNSPAAGYRQIELDFQDSKIGEKFIDTICFDYGVFPIDTLPQQRDGKHLVINLLKDVD